MRRHALLVSVLLAWGTVVACGSEDATADEEAPDATSDATLPTGEDARADATAGGDATLRDAGEEPDADAATDLRDAANGTDADAESTDASEQPDATPNERTLFVGNSYTFFHDMPLLYRAIAPDSVPPAVDSVAYGSYQLVQHRADAEGTGPNPRLAALLGVAQPGSTTWNHVVLQEQSLIPGLQNSPNTAPSLAAAVKLAELAEATGASTVLYMTWGYARGHAFFADEYPDYPTMQTKLAAGYRKMGTAILGAGHHAKIAPVGLAFRAIYDREVAAARDPLAVDSLFMHLYEADLNHPALPGSYLATCVLAATIYGADPTTFTTDVIGIDAATKLVLQTAARDVVTPANVEPPAP